MKLVYLNTTGTLGGAERCLLDLLASLRGSGGPWRPAVVLGADGPLRAEVEALDVPCTLLPLPDSAARMGDAGLREAAGAIRRRLALAALAARAAPSTAAYLTRLGSLLGRLEPDLVQTNGMKAHVLGAWAAPVGVPVVWHLHDFTAGRPVMARLLRLAARTRRRLFGVGVSHAVADDARAAFGSRVAVRAIYNAVDLDRFRPDGGPLADLDAGAPPAPPDTLRVGLVATFASWKGQEVFLEAIARIPASTPCRFYIVGGPIYSSAGSQYTFEELQARARALGVADRVVFSGHQADPGAALRALDVVVHASTRPEPFGRVIVEGMACGKAVIAARAGGAAELFEEGIQALGCPPGDPSALASAIVRLVADPSLRLRLGQAALDLVRQRFDRTRLVAPWSELYHDAKAGPRRRESPRRDTRTMAENTTGS